jgi:hypothetical protein
MVRMSALSETEFQPARPSRERTYGAVRRSAHVCLPRCDLELKGAVRSADPRQDSSIECYGVLAGTTRLKPPQTDKTLCRDPCQR